MSKMYNYGRQAKSLQNKYSPRVKKAASDFRRGYTQNSEYTSPYAASDDYEEEYEAPGNPYAASEKIVLENEQVIVEEKPSLPISAIQEHSNKEWISRLYNIGYNPSMNFAHKLAAFNAHTKKHANVLHAYEQGNEIMRFLT